MLKYQKIGKCKLFVIHDRPRSLHGMRGSSLKPQTKITFSASTKWLIMFCNSLSSIYNCSLVWFLQAADNNCFTQRNSAVVPAPISWRYYENKNVVSINQQLD